MADDNDITLRTTGELAALCHTTVRTVQYYDQKGLLAPSGYSEGGRRLYTANDAAELRFILMLKDTGLGLSQIRGVLQSPNRASVLQLLLDERKSELERELEKSASRLAAVRTLRDDIDRYGWLTLSTDEAVAARMSNNNARKLWIVWMITLGILMDIAWIGTLALGVLAGIWWAFPIGLVVAVALGVFMMIYYSRHVTYVCPACHREFRPAYKTFVFSAHTPRTRRLACPCCGEKDWCVERFHKHPVALAPGECASDTCS